ncbi:glycosyl hydrolase family 81-domain-containing protein [Pavlovales sp. CCMP2436]|nr:glycosyl hydrolase family 81-domain-containing protein [Pavlovales sp. CCMP2436]
MADGKSQESSSESVNAYYAAVLLAEAVGDAPLLNWAKFLLATEVRAVQWYWHVPSNSRIYDERFVASHTMVGVVGATDVNAATWFGANLELKNNDVINKNNMKYSSSISLIEGPPWPKYPRKKKKMID